MIVKRIITLGIFLILTAICPNRFRAEELPAGARSPGMAGVYVAIASNIETLFLNPGGLAQLHGTEFLLFYQKPFGLDELSYSALAVSHPILNTRTGIGLTSFGNALYREQQLTLSTGFHFRRQIYYGLSLNYKTIRIRGYGETGTLNLDLGFLIKLSDALQWGFHTTNLNRASVDAGINDVPQSFKTGFAFKADPGLLVALEIFKEIRYDEEFRFGLEFMPFTDLALRAGIANNPDRFSAGIGIHVLSFRIDYAFFTHGDLGTTHQASLAIHFGKPAHAATAGQHRKPDEVREHIDTAETEKSAPGKFDLNRAQRAQLMTLPGIGETLADTILEYRKVHGPFREIEEIKQIPGIGQKTFEKLRKRVFVKNTVSK